MRLPLTNGVRGRLAELVNPKQPFGPPASEHINSDEIAAHLFDWHNHAFADLLNGSHLVIGRRGAGKSALVRSYEAQPYIDFDDNTAEVRAFKQQHNIAAGKSLRKPDITIKMDTFKEIFDLEKKYFGLPIPPPEVMTPDWERRIWFLVARKLVECRPGLLPRDIENTINDTVPLERPAVTAEGLAAEVEAAIKRVRLNCLIICDSGDEYKFDPLQNRVLEGLCRATSNFIARQRGLDFRLCIPAEILEELSPHLSNPGKDIFSRQYLHWSASELFRIAAQRLRIYLEIYAPQVFAQIRDINIYERGSLWTFWSHFLPESIENANGRMEHTLIYLLRHTHLLPRQLLQVLNDICREHGDRTGDALFASPLEPEAIRRGVQVAEITNKQSVLTMYTKIYGNLFDLFEIVVPRFRKVFDNGFLHQVYNNSSAKHLMRSVVYTDPDFHRFRRLLISSGAIGLVEKQSDSYVEARFQFNELHQIMPNERSRFCVHPIFSRAYNIVSNPGDPAILPRGSDFRQDLT